MPTRPSKPRSRRPLRRAAEVERRRREAEASARVLGGAEFQKLVAYVLEGTLFNLVSEVSLGEFPLDTVPRQIVLCDSLSSHRGASVT